MRTLSYLLLSLLSLIYVTYCQENINLPLQRREYTLDFKSSVPTTQMICMEDNPDPAPKKKKKAITQLCIIRNLFYNMEVTIGTKKDKFELALDLLSPYTWVKSDSCKNCKDRNGEYSCDDDCTMSTFDQTHQCIKKKKCEKTNETVSLDYINHNFTGIFVYENLKIESNDDDFPSVPVKRFKIVDVDTINNAPFYNSDGGLGLGLEDDDTTDSESPENDSGFVTSIMKAVKEMEERTFSIYIRENDPNDDAYQPTIIFGDVDNEYQDKEEDPIKIIKINNNSKFDWDLPILSMKLSLGDQSPKTEIAFTKPSAILTLDTTFIGFPAKELKDLISYLNEVGLNCKKDTEKFKALYCSNVGKDKLKSIKFEINFQNSSGLLITVSLDPLDLIKECSGTLSDTRSTSCYFNIYEANSKSTILGEAFMKKFYTIFYLDTKTVGLVEAVKKEDEPIKHIVKREGKKFSRFLKYFFILLGALLVILCPFYVYQLCKIYRRKKANLQYEEGNTVDKIGEDSAYDFQVEMKEKLEARRKAEEQQKATQI